MENKMIPVLVTLHSYSKGEHGEKEQPVRLMCHGRMRPTNDGCMLRYEEVQQDDTGATVSTDVILNIQLKDGPRVTMTRMGDYGTTMVFVKDRRFEGVYRTPYGDMEMALFATRVDVELGEDKGSVYLEYQLDFAGGFASMHTMQLEYTASEKPC